MEKAGRSLHKSHDMRNQILISGKSKRFSFSQVQTGPEAQPSSYSTDTAGIFPDGKGIES